MEYSIFYDEYEKIWAALGDCLKVDDIFYDFNVGDNELLDTQR